VAADRSEGRGKEGGRVPLVSFEKEGGKRSMNTTEKGWGFFVKGGGGREEVRLRTGRKNSVASPKSLN